jgi:hypothetical protein
MSEFQRHGTTQIEIPGTALTPAERLRLSRLGRELRLTDQILCDSVDSVRIVERGPAPAWTSLEGDTVSFSINRMPFPESRLDVAVWLGTNAHELGHALFSPRRGSALMGRVIAADQTYLKGIADLHNIAEDQRQERLVLDRFAPWRAYLVAALSHHLVVSDKAAWLLLCGRTWLPAKVRAEAKAAFTQEFGAASADQVALLIGRYQRLVEPGDLDHAEAWDILEALHSLFTSVPPLRQRCQSIEGGEPEEGEASSSAPATADEADGQGEGEGTEGEGEGEADGAAGEGSGEGQPTEGGKGSGRSANGRQDRLEQLKAAASEQLDAEDVAKDLDAILEALETGRGAEGVAGAAPQGRYEVATDSARRLHHEVADALLELKDANEPGWVRRTDGGRLNVSRLINPNVDVDELFDRWEPGQLESNELELVLLLDVSGSMGSKVGALAEAAWAIRQAVDDLEGRCTVITWDDGPHRVLAAPGERPDDRMFVPATGNGTDPRTALTEAYRQLVGSEATNRLCVILTDGCWQMAQRSEEVISSMNEAGVLTVCALLGSAAGKDTHRATWGERLGTLDGLARLFGRVAASRMASA